MATARLGPIGGHIAVRLRNAISGFAGRLLGRGRGACRPACRLRPPLSAFLVCNQSLTSAGHAREPQLRLVHVLCWRATLLLCCTWCLNTGLHLSATLRSAPRLKDAQLPQSRTKLRNEYVSTRCEATHSHNHSVHCSTMLHSSGMARRATGSEAGGVPAFRASLTALTSAARNFAAKYRSR